MFRPKPRVCPPAPVLAELVAGCRPRPEPPAPEFIPVGREYRFVRDDWRAFQKRVDRRRRRKGYR